MEQETTVINQSLTQKVYKEREIWVGTLVGGTLAAGYMVAANYKAFGEFDKIRKTWIVIFAATAFIFYISFFAPYLDRIPNQLFSLIFAGIVIVSVQIYQGEKIRSHIHSGGQIQSWWKTLGVAFAGLCITVAMFLGIGFILTAFEEWNTTSKTYGRVKHEIFYDRSNIAESEVDQIADALTKENLFTEDSSKWYVRVRKVETNYEISLSVSDLTLHNPQHLESLIKLRNGMQSLFPNNKIIINLVAGNFDKIEKRIE